jgi:hypothetical protein
MAKRGEDGHEDPEMREEREARVDEMLTRAKRSHPTTPKKRAARKSTAGKIKKR